MWFATLISKIFEPYLVIVFLVFFGAVHSGLRETALVSFLLFFLSISVLPALGFRLWLVKTKGLHWDIPDRKKRIGPLAGLMVLTLIDYFLIVWWQRPVLSNMFQLFVFWVIGFFLVTLFWKISGHAGVAALATGLMISWFGWNWWPVLLIVPLVGWARVKTGNHTVGQVILGALYSWGVLQLVKLV